MKRTILLVLLLLLVLVGTLAVVRSHVASNASGDQPEIVYFSASPQQTSPGESVTLNWETRGVNSVALEWGPENHPRDHMQKRPGLPPSGMMTFQPREDTIFLLECETAAALACSSSASVKVR